MGINSNPRRQQVGRTLYLSAAEQDPGRIDNPSYEAEGILDLYQLCCAHLDREQAHLESACDLLRQVYAAGLASTPQRLRELLPRQAEVARATETLRLKRDQFRAKAGTLLGIPAESVTLPEIAHHLPAAGAQQLLQRRHELQHLAQDAEKVGNDIALFSHYFLDFLRRFFIQITGATTSGRYGPGGLRRDAVCGSLLQAQG